MPQGERDAFKRESGANPEQTRYCNRQQHPDKWSLPNGGKAQRCDGSQETCLVGANDDALVGVGLLFNFYNHKMKKVLVAALLVAGLIRTAGAASAYESDSIKMNLKVDEVVVVGQRMAVKKENVSQRIEMIHLALIERAPQKDLTSILKENAGLDVVQYPGILSGVSIRGFRPENGKLNSKTLILINGRPAGSANLGMIDLSNVERVEVLKGPASALYGPTAMGGVVNIITKNSKGAIGGMAAFSYGTCDKVNSSVSAGGSITSKLDFDAGFSISNNPKDYKMGKGNIFRGWLGGGEVTNFYKKTGAETTDPDKRGDGDTRPFTKYTKTNMDLRLGYDICRDWKLNAYVNRSIANDVESPGDIAYGTTPTRKDLNYSSGDISLTGSIGRNVTAMVKGYYGRDVSDDEVIYEKKAFVTPYLSISRELEWSGVQAQSVVRINQHHITIGVDYAHSQSLSERYNNLGERIKPYNQDFALRNFGLYVQGNLEFFKGKLLASLGGRYDFNKYDLKQTEKMTNPANKENNAIFSPSLGITYKVLPGLSIKANAGSGFSYADVYQLAGYSEVFDTKNKTVAITVGNKNLKNLESKSFDLGVSYNKNGWSTELGYFRTESKNNGVQVFVDVTADNLNNLEVKYTTKDGKFIYADGSEIKGLNTFQNASTGTIDGLEASVAYNFGYLAANRFDLTSYIKFTSILNANEELDEYGLGKMSHRMLNVADNNIVYGTDYKSNKLSAGFKGRYVGYRYDRNWSFYDQYVEVRYPQMMTLDLYLGYDVTKKISLMGYVSNVTDENYYEKRGYNLPGRMFSMKATINF